MKEVFEALKVADSDTFAIALAKKVSKLHVKAVICTLTFIVRMFSSKEVLKKFKEEMEA